MIGPIRRGMVRRHANTDTRFSIDDQPLLPRAASNRTLESHGKNQGDDNSPSEEAVTMTDARTTLRGTDASSWTRHLGGLITLIGWGSAPSNKTRLTL